MDVLQLNTLLAFSAGLLEVDAQAFEHHPVRILFGCLCLLLALLLTLWKVLRPKLRRSRRERSYGEGFRLILELMFPSYKGGHSSAKSADLSSSLPNSHRSGRSSAGSADLSSAAPASHKRSGSQERYGSCSVGLPIPFYKGGKSRAGEAHVPGDHTPSSHRTRLRDLPRAWLVYLPLPSYKGGKSSAKNADLSSAVPESHKKAGHRDYGSFRFGLPIPFYKGGKSRAGEAHVPGDHTPNSHRTRLRDLPRAWLGSLPLPSYRGGASRAKNADLSSAPPESHKRSGGQSRYGVFRFGLPIPFYKGGKSRAGEAHVPGDHTPRSHRTRLRDLPRAWMGYLPLPSYKGGASRAKNADLAAQAPERYRGGNTPGRQPMEPPAPSYKGSLAPIKEFLLLRHAPQSHRPRFTGALSSQTLPGVVDSYKGGYGVAGVGKPIQELPLSYREPWGTAMRYGLVSLPRLDGSPTPTLRGLIEPPPSYKEPWGRKRRYGFISWPRLDGSPTPTIWGLVELPPSYKEPWKGSCTHPRGLGLWQNPDTGEVYVEHMSDKKRFGTSRYGGKLYGMRSQTYFKYHRPDPVPDAVILRPPEPEEEGEA